jgi:hypothetical protein
MDANIAKEIFNSKIPVRIYHGNTSSYAQIFRASYLLIELKEIIPETSKFPYFTDKLTNLPLKWKLPISVLHDIYTVTSSQNNSEISSVWEIILHNPENKSFFPEDLLEFNTWQDATKYQTFMMAKAADHIRNRGDTISKLTPQQKEFRWTAFETRNFENFWSGNVNLLSSSRNQWPMVIHTNKDGKSKSKMTLNTQFEAEAKQSDDVFYEKTGNEENYFLNGVRVSASQVIEDIELVSRSCVMPDNCLHLVVK